MKDISDKIIERIKKGDVKPYSKWHFVFHRSAIWILFGITILIGSIACGIAIFQLQHAEWDLYRHLSHSLPEFIILIVPYFWLIFMIGFTVFAYYFFRHTERGYRYSAVAFVLVSLGISIVGGLVFHKAGLAESLEGIFRDRVSFYRALQERRERVWMAPENGLLAGKITAVKPDGAMELLDLNTRQWTLSAPHAVWRGNLTPEKGLKIKIIGRMKNSREFVAEEIRPWGGRRRRYGQGVPPHGHAGRGPRFRNRGFRRKSGGKTQE
jgi:uncharacterized membrane protein